MFYRTKSVEGSILKYHPNNSIENDNWVITLRYRTKVTAKHHSKIDLNYSINVIFS